MGWSKDHGTAAKVNAEYAREQGNVAKQEATNLAELKSSVEAATQNASTAAENANAVIVDANTAASNADSAASEAFTQANHAKNQGDRAKAEADRLAGTDVSKLDSKITEVTTQLAQSKSSANKEKVTQNINSSLGVNIGSKKQKRPLVTFIDDDGKAPVMTRLKPIFESRGVPCTLAIVSTFVNTPGCCTRDELLQLQDLGWEIASHEKTHIAMGNVTDEQKIYDEIVNSKKELLDFGFNVKNIVYPFGQTSSKLLEYVSNTYKAGVTTNNAENNQTNQTPISNYLLRRVALGSFGGATQTLEHYKSVVDKAIAENSWLIFMTHIEAQDVSQDALLGQTIDYILEKGAKIVNLDEGLDYFGDKLNIKDTLRITADDKVVSDKFVVGVYDTLINTSALADDVNFILAKYGKNQIIHSKFTSANRTGMPIDAAGLLTTYLETTEKGYIYQTYRVHDKDIVYTRVYKYDNTWTTWETKPTNPIFTKFVTSANLVFGTIPAKSVVHVSVPITNLGYSHGAIANPYYGLENGLVSNCAVLSAGNLRISVTNVTDAPVICDDARWVVTIFA